MLELNENNQAIVFPGYDLIVQPSLFMKLAMFMIIFGMNAPGNLKWVCGAILVAYYFHIVHTLFNEHYERQRVLLNINRPAGDNIADVRIDVRFIGEDDVF
jgi:hypothetical protein